MKIFPIVMCGGGGTRLWPASTPSRPKQFLSLVGDQSTYQMALKRAVQLPHSAQPVVVTGAAMADLALEQALSIGITPKLIIEPEARDTGPAIAAAAAYVLSLDPDGVMIMLAADHYIGETEKFTKSAIDAATAASENYIVTFGIKPTAPATGYGYIQPGAGLSDRVFAVQAFVEKPDAPTALGYMTSGFFWNSGIFAFPAALILSEMRNYAPELAAGAVEAVEKAIEVDGRVNLDANAFSKAPKISLDYAVMEKTRSAAVIAAEFTWSDLGAWDAIWAVSERDDADNATYGPVVVKDTAGAIVRSDGPSVGVVGLSDIIVIAEAGSVLVCPRSRAQDVKMIAELARAATNRV